MGERDGAGRTRNRTPQSSSLDNDQFQGNDKTVGVRDKRWLGSEFTRAARATSSRVHNERSYAQRPASEKRRLWRIA